MGVNIKISCMAHSTTDVVGTVNLSPLFPLFPPPEKNTFCSISEIIFLMN
jgi:hypothetical protein